LDRQYALREPVALSLSLSGMASLPFITTVQPDRKTTKSNEAVLKKSLIGTPLQPLKELTYSSLYPTPLPPIWASRKEDGYPQNLPSRIPSIGPLAGI
jgi:hypothetical protein